MFRALTVVLFVAITVALVWPPKPIISSAPEIAAQAEDVMYEATTVIQPVIS